jgi:alpha-mannosidase
MTRAARTILVVFLSLLCITPVIAQTTQPASHVKQIILVFKTHFDIGYTDLAKNVVERYRTQFVDKAISVYDETKSLPRDKQFVWTVPGWPLTQMISPAQTPERRARIAEMIQNGNLVWHALPFSTHTESLELEDLVRGMRFSSELSRSFNQPLVRDAKMTDVPSHTWIVPTLLKHAGIEFVQLGCNAASAVPDVPVLS